MSSLLQKFHFPIESVLNYLQTQKGLELVFRLQFLQNFLMKFFLLQCDTNWPDFINRLCLLHWNVFLVLCLRIWWHHEFWKCRTLKFDFLKNKKRFWSEIKKKFLQLTSTLIQTKQTSKNATDTTFKEPVNSVKSTFFFKLYFEICR